MAHPSRQIPFTCETCKKQCSAPLSRFKRGNPRFCSSGCAKAGMTNGEQNPNWKGGLATCQCLQCGATFQVKQKEVRRGSGKYCSRTCLSAANAKARAERQLALRVIKTCVICGKEKSYKPSHAERLGTYCSRKCMTIGYTTRLLGDNNPNFKEAGYANRCKNPQRQRQLRKDAKLIKTHSDKEWQQLKQMYNNTCPCCKRKDVPLTKDHIVPITKGGHDGIDNIQPLCRRCNVKKFTNTIVFTQQLIIPL